MNAAALEAARQSVRTRLEVRSHRTAAAGADRDTLESSLRPLLRAWLHEHPHHNARLATYPQGSPAAAALGRELVALALGLERPCGGECCKKR